MKKAYLVLENGSVFEGMRIGSEKDSIGELVFTTGVVGYLETLTDPSYAGQIVLQTFPLIGNYGVIEEDFEGISALNGYVVRELCEDPSNFRSLCKLDDYLKRASIPGICGVDTRNLTRILREQGVMNAMICSEIPQNPDGIRAYRVSDEMDKLSCKEIEQFPAEGEEKYHVCLMDYGAKHNIVRCLQRRGCRVSVLPCSMSAERILALNPDGVMLSNGPGDPADNTYCIEQIKKLIGIKPIFGICLGHQMLALAMGGQTCKLKYGHRGANQPVKRLRDGICFITSQNHGYAVVNESMEGKAFVSFINANDASNEGLEYPDLNMFSVQFHPEGCSGPRDTEFLFDDFIGLMGGNSNA